MHGFLKRIAVIVSDLEHIHTKRGGRHRPWKMTRDYLRLRIKASLNRWFHFTTERFLNYTVTFPDYEIFFVEYRQIFVRNAYFFLSAEATPHIIDGGGNIGMSVLYFKYLYPDSSIVVFEPSREVVPSIRSNIKNNNLTNIELIEKALAQYAGTATMHARGAAACGNTLSPALVKESGESYTVETVPLSLFVTTTVDMLKLDIEGVEGAVIKELEEAGAFVNIRTIIMEYHPHENRYENNLAHIIHTLQDAGWHVDIFSEDEVNVHSLSLRTLTKQVIGGESI
jgi:FkbM family methyltransferase